MEKCIFCGKDCDFILNPVHPMGLATHIRCVNCNLIWTVEEHKDNQDWNIRHTRLLEQRVQTLESQIKELIELIKKQ